MYTLYPEIKPYITHEIAIEAPHRLYYDLLEENAGVANSYFSQH